MKVSGCCFIRNTFEGAFCIFESMASMLPFVDEFVVLDLGSTDGTLEYLERIAEANPRVRLERGAFPVVDAGAFATLANDLAAMCEHDVVWYCQADEIPHERLLTIVEQKFAQGMDEMAFWRIQLGYNFQTVKWFPQVVHRVGRRGGRFNFVGDGMNTDCHMDVPICSDYGGEYFIRWGDMGQEGVKPYTDQMLLDVSLVGGFRDNVPTRRALHAPFWHEEPVIPYRAEGAQRDRQLPASEWMKVALADERWTRDTSPYNIPGFMRFHVGKTEYHLRPELFDALCADRTRDLLGV